MSPNYVLESEAMQRRLCPLRSATMMQTVCQGAGVQLSDEDWAEFKLKIIRASRCDGRECMWWQWRDQPTPAQGVDGWGRCGNMPH